jgi:hypothetical protein
MELNGEGQERLGKFVNRCGRRGFKKDTLFC